MNNLFVINTYFIFLGFRRNRQGPGPGPAHGPSPWARPMGLAHGAHGPWPIQVSGNACKVSGNAYKVSGNAYKVSGNAYKVSGNVYKPIQISLSLSPYIRRPL